MLFLASLPYFFLTQLIQPHVCRFLANDFRRESGFYFSLITYGRETVVLLGLIVQFSDVFLFSGSLISLCYLVTTALKLSCILKGQILFEKYWIALIFRKQKMCWRMFFCKNLKKNKRASLKNYLCLNQDSFKTNMLVVFTTDLYKEEYFF